MIFSPFMRVMVVPMLGLAGVLACRLSPPLVQGMESGVVMRLPGGVNRFIGEPGVMSEEEKRLLPGDTEIVRMHYRTADYGPGTQDQVEFTLVQAGSERRSIHRPEVCLTGQGWTLLNSATIPIEISPGQVLNVKDLWIEKTVQAPGKPPRPIRAHYLYWFVGMDVSTPHHAERIWLTTWHSVARNVNHRWAYASALALVTDNFTPQEIGQRIRDADQTLAMLTALVRDLAPKFQKGLMPPDT